MIVIIGVSCVGVERGCVWSGEGEGGAEEEGRNGWSVFRIVVYLSDAQPLVCNVIHLW